MTELRSPYAIDPRAAMSSSPDSAGGHLIEDELSRLLATQLALVAVAENFAFSVTANHSPFKIPILRTPSGVSVVAEADPVPNISDPVFAQADAEIVKHAYQQPFSNEWEEDTASETVSSWVASTANQLSASEERVFWQGNSSPAVTGILPAITNTVSGPADVASITLAHLTDLVKAVSDDIAGPRNWFMSPSTFSAISSNLQGSVGYISPGQPSLLGWPVQLSSGLPGESTTTGNLLAFGPLAACAAFVRRAQPRVTFLRELLAATDQSILSVRSRCGPAMLDATACSALAMTGV